MTSSQEYWTIVCAHKWVIVCLLATAIFLTSIQVFPVTTWHEASILFAATVPAWEDDYGKPIAPALFGLGHPFRVQHISLRESFYWELYSRTLLEAIIQELNLQQHYGTKTLAETRMTLSGRRTISLMPGGHSFRISVVDRDPRMAVAIANAHLRQLDRLHQKILAQSVSSWRTLVERQLTEATLHLKKSEEEWYPIYFYPKVPPPAIIEGKSDESLSLEKSPIQSGVKLRIIELERDLAALRRFAKDTHPLVHEIKTQIEALRHALNGLETGAPPGEHTFVLPQTALPEIFLQNSRLERESKWREHAYRLWRGLLEETLIEESLDLPRILVLDPAIAVERRSKTWEIILVAAGLALILSVMGSFLLSYFENLQRFNSSG